MASKVTGKPVLVYDGDCSFCRLWIGRWEAITRDRIQYAPFQQVADQFPEIPREHFARSVQLILPSGEVASGAHAVFRTLAVAPGRGWMLWLYLHIPGAAPISEWAYRFVAQRREFFYTLTRLLWGKHFERPSFFFSRWLFLRLLGVIYLLAFLSLATQVTGLVGRNGILPVDLLLNYLRVNVGPERYWLFPSLVWLNVSDTFLRLLTLSGAIASLFLLFGIATMPILIILWMSYLSLVVAGQDFMAFQWDALLLETGFLAIFFAPSQLWPRFSREPAPSSTLLWLFRLLLFRLMFSSGAGKLLSGDPTWRHLTALEFHYETQPLPTVLAWYVHLLPAWFHKLSAGLMFFIELVVPFGFFAPRRLRLLAGGLLIFLQILIGLTGNYAFFNILAIALCLLLFDDACLARLFPRRWVEGTHNPEERTGGSRFRRWVVGPVAAVLAVVGLLHLAALFAPRALPRPTLRLMGAMEPLRLVNSYGLFSIMTTSRPEIVLEGSNDGATWVSYEFKYKPGDLRRAPCWIEPFQHPETCGEPRVGSSPSNQGLIGRCGSQPWEASGPSLG